MRSERWQRLTELLETTLAVKPGERAAVIERMCRGDIGLKAEIESLLEAHTQPGVLDHDLMDWLTPLVTSGGDASIDSHFDHPGPRVGPYQVGKRIGGVMGSVYRARDERLDREVALKLLPPHLGADRVARARFQQEARVAASLEHPNICTILDVGETGDGRLFLAMPFYRGESLEEMLSRGPLPIQSALEITLQVARGLAKAHANGIVHRDIKPANIFVTEDGVARVLDFGIAKLAGLALTGAGRKMGTVAYMSPEQASGAEVDARTDLWSLGAVLYEMLTGERPFRGETATEMLSAILHARPDSIAERRPGLPPALPDLIEALLTKEPANRLQRADELASALEAIAATGGRARYRRRRFLAPTALVLIALGAGVLTRQAPSDGQTRATSSEPRAIAVLPFERVAGSNANPTLAGGIHADVVTALSEMGALRVAARGSVLPYSTQHKPLRQIADELGVDVLLEGAVQQVGERVRINVQLSEPRTGRVLWAERYDRELTAGTLFAIQSDIVSRIVAALERSLTPSEQLRLARAPTENLSAYEFYQRARLAFDGSIIGNLESERLLREALSLDSTYAHAWGMLAMHWASRPLWTGHPTAWWDSAAAAAERALALDPGLATPYLARAILAKFQGHPERAEREARIAVERNPSQAQAFRQLGESFRERGRFDEALAHHRVAVRLDPNSSLHRSWIGHLHLDLGEPAVAERWYREVLRLEPQNWTSLEGLAVARFLQGDTASALELVAREAAAHPRDPAALTAAAMVAHYARDPAAVHRHGAAAAALSGDAPVSSWDMLLTTLLGHAAARAGEPARADSLFTLSRRFLDERMADGARAPRWIYEIALLEAAAGRNDVAMQKLEAAYDAGFRWSWMLEHNPMLDDLRPDPRFGGLVQRIRNHVAAMQKLAEHS